jgi:fused signal recognition particle receptor
MESLQSFVNELLAMLPEGTDPQVVLCGIAAGIALLLLLVMALRSSVYRNFDRGDIVAVAKRVEQLEGSMAALREEMRRALQELQALEGGDPGSGEQGGGAVGGGQAAPSTGGESGGGVGTAPVAELAKVTAAANVQVDSSPIVRGLAKSRSSFLGRLKGFFSGRKAIDQDSLDELEELLILSDVGAKVANNLVEKVRVGAEGSAEVGEERLRELLKAGIRDELVAAPENHRMYLPAGSPQVVLVVGVNGVGKTTTVAKLAAKYMKAGKKVMVIAADTFRAAAVAQLEEWSSRVGFTLVKGAENAKPGAVVFDGMAAAKDGSVDVVLIDTAGRLHTKSSLMQELEGVRNSIRKHVADAPHETIIVLDGVSGQNALQQAREFNAAVPLTGVVVTKLDGTPKGGIIVAICQELRVPVLYVGVGEKAEDLVAFDASQFIEGLFGGGESVGGGAAWIGAQGASSRGPEVLLN